MQMAIERETVENLLKLTKPRWKTSITKVEPNRIITRGYPQEDLIGNISFPEMVYLLLKGEFAQEKHAKMLEAVLVSFCDHGVTPPSTQVARIMASSGSPLNSCVAGGISSFGKHHAGALERSMCLLQKTVKENEESNKVETSHNNLKDLAHTIVEHYLKNSKKIPGFGHRFHHKDPRADKLIKTAKKYGCFGIHTELIVYIEDLLMEMKCIHMNIDGANAGILSDMGFDWRFGTGIFMIGRVPALISHIHEEKTNETPFRKFVEVEDVYFHELIP